MPDPAATCWMNQGASIRLQRGSVSCTAAARIWLTRTMAAVILIALFIAPTTAVPAAASVIAATPVAPNTARHPTPFDAERQAAFAAFIVESMAELGVPGAAVAVVQDDDVVFLEGFGEREIGTSAPVTPDTLFMIGSITKPLTSLMAATLVDDGLVTWDTPVTDLLPEFQTADPELTARLTLADLFCACTGIPNRDEWLFWNADDVAPEDLVSAGAVAEPGAPFGEEFFYSNEVFSIGGYAAAAAVSTTNLAVAYRQTLRDNVLDPIGMNRSTFELAAVKASEDFAVPHAVDPDGAIVSVSPELDERLFAPIAPAAGFWSSAREMARLLQTLLEGGMAPSGTRVVSSENLDRIWTQRIAAGERGLAPPHARGYGLGWFTGEVQGHRYLGHSGSTVGFDSHLALLPDIGLGVVILTNGGRAATLPFAVQQRLFELVLEAPKTAELDVDRSAALTGAALAAMRARLDEVDVAIVEPFLGSYRNPVLGTAELRLEGNRLMLDWGEASAELWRLRDRAAGGNAYVLVGSAPVGGVVRLESVADGRQLVLGGLVPGLGPPTRVFESVPAETEPTR